MKIDKKTLVHFLDSIRDYENESGKAITHDERESEEFVEIYLKDNPIQPEWIKLSDKQPNDLTDIWRWGPMFAEPRLDCYMKQKFELGMYGDDSYWIQAYIPQPPKE